MELRDALTQITEIRCQVARTETFRGYRAGPIAFSGLLAFAAATAQAFWLNDPAAQINDWVSLWFGVAAISVVATGGELTWSMMWRSPSRLHWQQTLCAVTQFLPCLGAGALLFAVVMATAPELVWLLPGLWAMFFGLGILASWHFLPRAITFVGAFYILAGALCLTFARNELALAPWAMGLPFGCGQLLTAAVLYWNLERADESK